LHRLLKQIVARRHAERGLNGNGGGLIDADTLEHSPSGTTIDEVAEIITLPTFNAKAATSQENPDSIQLPRHVIDQLYDYVFNIAAM